MLTCKKKKKKNEINHNWGGEGGLISIKLYRSLGTQREERISYFSYFLFYMIIKL